MAVERLIGVDFGTSTSVIRVKRYDEAEPVGEKLETKEVIFGGNGTMVPTLIMKKDDDPSVCYFGYEAQQKKKKFTNFHSFKMDLESSDPAVRARARQLTEEFYAYLAKQYKSQSDGGHLGNPDDQERTIISYPVKWTEETKHFMLETAKKAGFPNVSGMDEAQAAIQAVIVMSTDHLQKHGLLQDGIGTNILLIDMGAGTTDLVLARYTPGEDGNTEILNTWPKSGDIQFGGREIDHLLQAFFRELLQEDDAEMVFRRIGSDKFKSWKEETVSPALAKNDPVRDFEALDSYVEDMEIELKEYCLDRSALEHCLSDYLKQFPELINGCLRDAGINGGDVDLVIITGGHSQWYFVGQMLCGSMPQFGELDLSKIREDTARIISISRPQETVALGLAYSGIRLNFAPLEADPPDVTEESTETAEPERIIEPPKTVEPEKTVEPMVGKDDEHFVMVFDSSYMVTETLRGTWVRGSVSKGSVRLGDKVFACGGVAKARLVEVKEILDSESRRMAARADRGDKINVLLAGISAEEVRGRTHLSGVEEGNSLTPTRMATVEEMSRAPSAGGEFLFEVSFLGVQWTDTYNRKTRVSGYVRGGQIRVGEELYLRKPSGDLQPAIVEKIESAGLLMDVSASVANDRTKRYLLTLSGVVAEDFTDVKFLQGKVAAANEYKATWENVSGIFQTTIQTASDAVRQTAQRIEQQRLTQQTVETQQDVTLMQMAPDSVSYTPENEFEVSVQADSCVILKYLGSRTVVSIPPSIKGRPVIAIGERAFSGATVVQGNKTLKMLIVPKSVCLIGAGAFAGCSNLNRVVAHDRVTNIGMNAFYGCNALQWIDFGMGPFVEGQVMFPPALQSIGASAFTRYALLSTTACIFRQIFVSRNTFVNNTLSTKTFDPRYCSVSYYD